MTLFSGAYPGTRAGSGTSVNSNIGNPDLISQGSGGGSGRGVMSASSIPDLVQQIVAANNANLDQAARNAPAMAIRTAQTLDPYMAGQFYQNLSKAYPDWQDTVAQQVSNTQQYMSGVIPEDAANLIRMYSAEQGMEGAHANTARNLGLTSLDLMNKGFEQGTQLAQQSQYLMPPTTDVSAWAGNYFGALADKGTLTPAQGLEAALSLRSQDLQDKWQNMQYSFDRERLRLDAEKFNAEMSWSRQLSEMNRAYDKWRYNQEMGMYRDAVAARAKEQKDLLNAYQSVASTIKGMTTSSSSTAPKPAPGTEVKSSSRANTTLKIDPAELAKNMPAFIAQRY